VYNTIENQFFSVQGLPAQTIDSAGCFISSSIWRIYSLLDLIRS
jgi:hypothetical protein